MISGPAVHVAVLAVSTLTTVALAGYAWRDREEPAVRPFAALMLAFTVYSGAHLVGLLTHGPEARFLLERIQWTGTAAIPMFWLLFAIEYAGYDEILTRRSVAAMAVVPVATVALTWTNGYHELMWAADARVVDVGGLAIVEQPFGRGLVACLAGTYAMLIVGTFLMTRATRLSDRLYATQARLLIVGGVAPILANVATLAGFTPIQNPTLDITPYAFSITGIAFGAALFRYRLFELSPATHHLGRNAALRNLDDGVVIVGTTREIVYANAAATALLGRDREAVLGERIEAVLDADALDFEGDDGRVESERDGRVYEVRTSSIESRGGRAMGHALVVREVTDRKHRERRLAEQRDELERQRNELRRRRGELQRRRDELRRLADLNSIIRGVNEALVSATSREEIERAVCERLAESERYRATCVADLPTWAGNGDRWTVRGTDEASADALRDLAGTVAVDGEAAVTTVETDPGVWTVVPIRYGDTAYGALALCAAEASGAGGTATERVADGERGVLAELGELIGHAVNAVENRRLLAAESVIELTFHSDDDDPLVGVSADTGARLALSGLVPDAGDGHLVYLDVTDGDADAVATALAERSGTRAKAITDHGRVEWTAPKTTVVGTVAEHGGHVLRASAVDGTLELIVEVAADADVRALVDRLQERVPGTEIDAKRERDRQAERADEVCAAAVGDLTGRQQEAVEVAYRAGYSHPPRTPAKGREATACDAVRRGRPATGRRRVRLRDRSTGPGRLKTAPAAGGARSAHVHG
ncbi:hypothetical protein BRD17_01785 [Halobacteriales archaeon SW_7_68_16]|nr:MAG: hypothetical protein BRD17_01785 [Halobacteriales archaeon SW_7_68_16]